MDRIVPWGGSVDLVAPYHPKGESGRPSLGLERMPWFYFLKAAAVVQPFGSWIGGCAL
jgi:IS5 family transposase